MLFKYEKLNINLSHKKVLKNKFHDMSTTAEPPTYDAVIQEKELDKENENKCGSTENLRLNEKINTIVSILKTNIKRFKLFSISFLSSTLK